MSHEYEDHTRDEDLARFLKALELMGAGPDATPESIRAEQEQYDQETARIREGTP